jgi:predicted DsbA family dithiol-disulfide isomerase
MKLTIDVVSDVVCPWCFIGKRPSRPARWNCGARSSRIARVAVHWRPFFLNPDSPEAGEPYRPFLERKFGGPKQVEELWQRVSEAGRQAGIAFAFEKIELRANTLHAHRLIHHAQTVMSAARPETVSLADGAGGTAIGDLVEALFAAQFLAGRHVGDRAGTGRCGRLLRHGARGRAALPGIGRGCRGGCAAAPTRHDARGSMACPSSFSTTGWPPAGRNRRRHCCR